MRRGRRTIIGQKAQRIGDGTQNVRGFADVVALTTVDAG
jgi:hypothetical protein